MNDPKHIHPDVSLPAHRPYKAFWKEEEFDVRSTSSYNAQTAAFNLIRDKYPRKKIKAHEITIVLADVPLNTGSL
jgi:hypothetical protein